MTTLGIGGLHTHSTCLTECTTAFSATPLALVLNANTTIFGEQGALHQPITSTLLHSERLSDCISAAKRSDNYYSRRRAPLTLIDSRQRRLTGE